ncbi:MAG: DNA replication and repair protein recF [uncultured bacterium (gcode 4)]|uniref:DNA replication and repair protein RecF n=1 Tax=uncultured bacterium (gcode 4) TaxID=1234023 RepID=K2FV80_9BACT|nr:MAG: DNA replication and repair protein recF [uncultured bacterium (gcode 4)]
MIENLRLFQFKNHTDISLDFDSVNLIYWENWSWKTNILEAIYLLLNCRFFSNNNVLSHIKSGNESLIVSWDFRGNFSSNEFKITLDKDFKKLNFLMNKCQITKTKYFSSNSNVAIFFSPMEVNIVYLWPSLRRDFLDEILSLTFLEFTKIKSDYLKILRNRNKLLKDISLWKADKADLNFWDNSFCGMAEKYYILRKKFIDYISLNIDVTQQILWNKYNLEFFYESKIDFNDIKGSISEYLSKNRERDIILWHTYIWPHLDDFYFNVKIDNEKYKSQDYLSRWENKSILICLKFLQLSFLEENNKKNVTLLLDDIFSELDDKHIALVMEKCFKYQTFITSQNIPSFFDEQANIKKIYIN